MLRTCAFALKVDLPLLPEETSLLKDIKRLTLELAELRKKPQDAERAAQEVNLLCRLGFAYRGIDPEKTRAFGTEALVLAEKHHDSKGMAACYRIIGIGYAVQDSYELALDFFLRELRYREDEDDNENLTACYNNLGLTYSHVNQYEKARTFLEQALAIRQKSGSELDVMNSYINLGNFYLRQEDYEKGLEYYQKALDLKRDSSDLSSLATIYNNMGNIHRIREAFAESRVCYEKALAIRQELNDKNGMSATYINLSEIFRQQRDYDGAIQSIQKGIELAREIGARSWEMEGVRSLSDVFESKGDLRSALDRLREYIQLREAVFNERNAQKLAEVQARYEIEQKEKETRLAETRAEVYRLRNERMRQELELARNIQANLLPPHSPEVAGLDIAAVCRPAFEVGGDYYDFVPGPTPGQLFIIIADVSGKGVPACLISIELRIVLRTLIDAGYSLQEIVTRANEQLHDDISRVNNPMTISLLLLCWDDATKNLTWVSAAHDPFIVHRAGATECEIMEPHGMWLGVVEDIEPFITAQTLTLLPGDRVLLYTDGVTEYHDDHLDLYGLERLKRDMAKIDFDLSAADWLQNVLDHLSQFGNDAPAHDDVTMIAMRRTV